MTTFPKISNRVMMTVASAPGTGTITLGAASAGYQSFSDGGFLNGDVVSYVLQDGTSWEIGTGTYSTSGPTLTRTPLQSSNTDGSAISASAAAIVFNTLLAQNAGISGPLTFTGNPGVQLVQPNGSYVSSTNPLQTASGQSFTEVTASIPSNTAYNGTTRATPAAGFLFVVHLSSSNYMGSWNIQQSVDGTTWTTVKTVAINGTATNSVLACDAVAPYYRVQLQTSIYAIVLTIMSSFTQQTIDGPPQVVTFNSTPNVAQIQGTQWTDTNTALAASATYTGTARTSGAASGGTMSNSTFFAMIYSDQPVTARLEMQDSGGTWYPCTNNVGFSGYKTLQAPAASYNFRIIVINGATAQTLFTVRSGFSRTGSIN